MKKPLAIRRFRTDDCITTIEVKQWLPVALLPFLLVWYLASPSKMAIMSLVTLLGISLTAFLWSNILAKNTHGQRRLRYTALQVGDELEEEVTLLNACALPVLWAEFVDRSNIPGYTVTSVRAADPSSLVHWRARAICSRRGVFMLGPWEMRMGDPFGIFQVRKLYHLRQEILVYPPLATLPPHLLKHTGAQGDQRPLHQPIHAETINAFSARPYIPGDPLRHLHWRTTARKGDPFVKLFEPEAATSIWLIPDCDAAVQLGQGDDSTFETMMLVLASLAAEMLHEQLSVGLFANAAEQSLVMPQRGQPHLWEILRALAPLQPAAERPLSQTLEKARQLMSARHMLVIITPSLNPEWLPQVRRLSGQRVMGRAEAILLDPASYGGSQEAESFLPLLREAGVSARILERGQIQPIAASYGDVSRWEFKELATGRAILRHTPREATQAASENLSQRWGEQP